MLVTSSCFSQKLKVLGIKKNPEEVAKSIVEQIPQVDFFEKVNILSHVIGQLMLSCVTWKDTTIAYL